MVTVHDGTGTTSLYTVGERSWVKTFELDSALLVTWHADGTLWLWDLSSVFSGTGPVTSARLNKDRLSSKADITSLDFASGALCYVDGAVIHVWRF